MWDRSRPAGGMPAATAQALPTVEWLEILPRFGTAAQVASVGGCARVTPRHWIGDGISNRAAQHVGNLPHLNHQAVELVGIERLVTITQRVVGVRMDLNNQPVGSHRDSGARHGRDLVALTG